MFVFQQIKSWFRKSVCIVQDQLRDLLFLPLDLLVLVTTTVALKIIYQNMEAVLHDVEETLQGARSTAITVLVDLLEKMHFLVQAETFGHIS